MHRTTILLPEELKIQVMHVADQEGVSLGQFIRESLEIRLQTKSLARDCFYEDESVFKGSSKKDIAKNHDDYLY